MASQGRCMCRVRNQRICGERCRLWFPGAGQAYVSAHPVKVVSLRLHWVWYTQHTSRNWFEALLVSAPCSKKINGWWEVGFRDTFFSCSTSSFAAFARSCVIPSSLSAKRASVIDIVTSLITTSRGSCGSTFSCTKILNQSGVTKSGSPLITWGVGDNYECPSSWKAEKRYRSVLLVPIRPEYVIAQYVPK